MKKRKGKMKLCFLGIQTKQETLLDKKIDDKHTLAEVLGVPSGSKLIVVDSSQIIDNENTTRFSCIIQTPDRKLHNADRW